MQMLIKIVVSVLIILTAVTVGRKFPPVAGLISVMPLTSAIVLVWLYMDSKGDSVVMQGFTRGALFGIIPTVLFFIAAYFCFRRNMPLSVVLTVGFSVWLCAALVHQWILR